MTPTDTQLKAALAKMLPDKLCMETDHDQPEEIFWKVVSNNAWSVKKVLDTELLKLCRDVEGTIKTGSCWCDYVHTLGEVCNTTVPYCVHASWQQLVTALAKVKGIEL